MKKFHGKRVPKPMMKKMIHTALYLGKITKKVTWNKQMKLLLTTIHFSMDFIHIENNSWIKIANGHFSRISQYDAQLMETTFLPLRLTFNQTIIALFNGNVSLSVTMKLKQFFFSHLSRGALIAVMVLVRLEARYRSLFNQGGTRSEMRR